MTYHSDRPVVPTPRLRHRRRGDNNSSLPHIYKSKTKWGDFDGLPRETKEFIWGFPLDINLAPGFTHFAPELKEWLTEQVRASTAKVYGKRHPNAAGASRRGQGHEITES